MRPTRDRSLGVLRDQPDEINNRQLTNCEAAAYVKTVVEISEESRFLLLSGKSVPFWSI